MAFTLNKFEVEEWGPKKLRKIFKSVEKAINERAPVKGLGIAMSSEPTGVEISTELAIASKAGGENSGAGGGGTSGDLYGSLNGQPAVFHLLQRSPPTLVNPEEE